jgi:dihydroneopterin aldolase
MSYLGHLIAAEGIKVYANHGCLESEALIGGEFVADVYVYVDFTLAAATDELQMTVDYAQIRSICYEEIKKRSRLIEQVAYRTLNRLVAELPPTISAIRLRLTKINPPVEGPMEKVFVELTYEK